MRTVQETKYTIMKDDLFFSRSHAYGKDAEGIVRIAKTVWTEDLDPKTLHSKQVAEERLKGILKYDREKNANYRVVKVVKKFEIYD